MAQQRNFTIDYFRLLMTFLIVALHSSPFLEYNAIISYFPSQVLSRIGVPFFASVAGYYFFKDYKCNYKKTALKYFIKYSFWSVIYFIFIKIFLNQDFSVIKSLVTYFFTGYYHLWYMLAIIYTIALLWIISKIPNAIKFFFYFTFVFLTLGIMMFGYGNIFLKLPIFRNTLGILNAKVNMQTEWLFSIVPFFMIGYALQYKSKFIDWLYFKCDIFLAIFSVIYVFEIFALEIFNLKSSTTLCLSTYPLVFFIMLFSLKHSQIGNITLAKYTSGIASFIYFSHIIFVLLLQKFGFSQTPTFFITIISTTILGFIIVKVNNRTLNKLM